MRSPSFCYVSIYLLLLLCLSVSLGGCGQPQQTSSPVLTWIKLHAIPLKTTDPQASLDDLQPLQQIVGSASIVGLGEATHGSHEFFTMKQRLLEFLVEKMGFTMFAMEGSWSAGEQINTYVLTGRGNARDVLQQFHFWTWNTQEVLALVQWVRAYDANPSHGQKVRFAGFDCQVIETITFDQVAQYLQAVDPQNAARVTFLYRGLRPDPAIPFTKYSASYFQLPQSTRKQYAVQAQQVYDLLKQRETQDVARSSSQAFAQALQEARVIVQGTQFMTLNPNDPQALAQSSQQRDAFMAENSAWLHEHADGGGKLVLWAHDGHIQTVGSTPMGMHLRERYPSQYLAIGTSFYQGSFNARGMDDSGRFTPLQSFSVQAPEQGSYNDMFGHAGFSLYALDLRYIPAGSVGQWMNGPHGFLTIGAAYDSAIGDTFYASLSLPESFDVIIHIQKVTASHLIPLSQ
ncbi:MAG: erythromycin esterase family protein [Chloroflexota bacterium]|nr:erythromycin esterase family protein [Chloroflexota bacterium]